MMREPRYKKIEGYDGIVKDQETGMVLNINKGEIQAARARKALRLKQKEENQQLKATVDKLEKEMSEIKNLLSQIVEKI